MHGHSKCNEQKFLKGPGVAVRDCTVLTLSWSCVLTIVPSVFNHRDHKRLVEQGMQSLDLFDKEAFGIILFIEFTRFILSFKPRSNENASHRKLTCADLWWHQSNGGTSRHKFCTFASLTFLTWYVSSDSPFKRCLKDTFLILLCSNNSQVFASWKNLRWNLNKLCLALCLVALHAQRKLQYLPHTMQS